MLSGTANIKYVYELLERSAVCLVAYIVRIKGRKC
jgi:hypothetical protein